METVAIKQVHDSIWLVIDKKSWTSSDLCQWMIYIINFYIKALYIKLYKMYIQTILVCFYILKVSIDISVVDNS